MPSLPGLKSIPTSLIKSCSYARPDPRNYCLPKDGGLGIWSYQTLMGFEDNIFKITPLAIVIDCFGILNDEKIKRYFELGCEVKGLGRGHVKKIKDQVKAEK